MTVKGLTHQRHARGLREPTDQISGRANLIWAFAALSSDWSVLPLFWEKLQTQPITGDPIEAMFESLRATISLTTDDV